MQAQCHQFQEPSHQLCTSSSCCTQKGSLETAGLQANMATTSGPVSSNNVTSTVWFPDSGATNHVTNDLQNLREVTQHTGHQDRDHVWWGTCVMEFISLPPHYFGEFHLVCWLDCSSYGTIRSVLCW